MGSSGSPSALIPPPSAAPTPSPSHPAPPSMPSPPPPPGRGHDMLPVSDHAKGKQVQRTPSPIALADHGPTVRLRPAPQAPLDASPVSPMPGLQRANKPGPLHMDPNISTHPPEDVEMGPVHSEQDPFLYRAFSSSPADEHPPYLNILAGEYDEPPPVDEDREEAQHTHAAGAGKSGWAKVREAFGAPGAAQDDLENQESSSGAQLTYRPSKYQRRAAALLQAHNLDERRRPSQRKDRGQERLPGGVLASLLMLYDEQQRALGRHPLSNTSKDMSSSPIEEASSEVEDESAPRAMAPRVVRRPLTEQPSEMQDFHFPPEKRHAGISSLAGKGAHMLGIDPIEGFERPEAARSGAGVFGALVATTGNLIGAVSPHSATLGPNPSRPGFKLQRYLLPEINAKTLKQTRKILASASAPDSPHRRLGSGSLLQSPSGTATPLAPPSVMWKTASSSATLLQDSFDTKGVSEHGDYFQYQPHSGGAPTTTGSYAVESDLGTSFPEHPRGGPESRKEWVRKLKKRKNKKHERIYITLHVAAILERQDFLLKLARALMMFGAPTHRIESHIQSTAKVLDIKCHCIYLPSVMLFSFSDEMTHTSDTRFIKQPSNLDLSRLGSMHSIYNAVIHDKVGVEEASRQLDELMRRPPLVGRIPQILIGFACSGLMAVGDMGFHGSLIDGLLAAPLGALVVIAQQFLTSDVLSSGIEIMMTCLTSFIAAASFQGGHGYFCYGAVASAAIVLILPGMLFLTAALELQSKSIIAGSVHLVWACIYSMLLGFGLSIGSALWTLVSGQEMILPEGMATCKAMQNHPGQPWRETVSLWWAFLVIPAYASCASLRNQAKPTRKEFPVMVIIAVVGWVVRHFASLRPTLANRTDFLAMLSSLAVGVLGSLYGRFFDGRAFVVSVPGMLYQLPSGLGNGGGLLLFAQSNSSTTTSTTFQNGFQVAQTLISTAMGLSVGLFGASAINFVFLGGSRTRSKGVFSF